MTDREALKYFGFDPRMIATGVLKRLVARLSALSGEDAQRAKAIGYLTAVIQMKEAGSQTAR